VTTSTTTDTQRLIRLKLFPLMYIYDLADVICVLHKIFKSLGQEFPTHKFNILNFFLVLQDLQAILKHKSGSPNSVINSCFFHLPKLWNSLPVVDLSHSITSISVKLKNYFWDHFINNFDMNNFLYVPLSLFCTKIPIPNNYIILLFNLYPFYLLVILFSLLCNISNQFL